MLNDKNCKVLIDNFIDNLKTKYRNVKLKKIRQRDNILIAYVSYLKNSKETMDRLVISTGKTQ